MSKSIYVNTVELKQISSIDVYQPEQVVKKGVHNNEEFSVLIRSSDLLPGVLPDNPVIDNLIAWDEAFYVEWTYNGSFEYFEIIITKSGTEVFRGETENFNLQFSSHLVNNVQYSLTVKVIGGRVARESNANLFTLTNKVPINYSIDSLSSTNLSVSWDDLTTDYSYYKVYLKDLSLNSIVKEVITEQTNLSLSIPNSDHSYETWVVSVSAFSIFESGKSNIEVIVAPPTNLSYNVQNDSVTFNWDNTSVDGYNLYVKSSGGAYVKENSSLINTNSYLLENQTNNSYEAYVTAVLDGVESVASNKVNYEILILTAIWAEQDQVTADVKGAIISNWIEQDQTIVNNKLALSADWIEQDEVVISTKTALSEQWSEQDETIINITTP